MRTASPRAALSRLATALASPLLPRELLSALSPELDAQLTARVVSISELHPGMWALTLRPSRALLARPGQYLPIALEIDGVYHWRSYSLTRTPTLATPELEIVVRTHPEGLVSARLADPSLRGTRLLLGEPTGEFALPSPLPPAALLIGAGSGITPFLGMLRHLAAEALPAARRGSEPTAPAASALHLVHLARTERELTASAELTALAQTLPALTYTTWISSVQGRLTPELLAELAPGWATTPAWACGPPAFLDALSQHWADHADPTLLRLERFAPPALVATPDALPELILARSGVVSPESALADGPAALSADTAGSDLRLQQASLLARAENAGALMPSGCRIGICHTCIVPLRSGVVRNLRTGEITDQPGEKIQTCISVALSPVVLDA